MNRFNLCFVGNMLGRRKGYITTQGQILADLFAAEGCETTCVSARLNRFARLGEILAALVTNRKRFDVVVIEVYSGLSFLIAETAGALCSSLKIPLVMWLHGGRLPEFIEQHPRRAQLAFRRADFLVAPSAFLAENIGANGFEIEVIPNVVDLNLYSFRSREKIAPRLVWMRSFHPIYNPEMAIRVLVELKKDFPAATLTMAGADKGWLGEIKNLVVRLNLQNSVCFPGFLDSEQKTREFQSADIYLHTNRADNMPVSVLEACAAGLPVVATNVGGLPYLIETGENGLLVENENVFEMVAAVKKLLTNPQLTRRISLNARRLAERSAWSAVKPQWENLFAAAINLKSSSEKKGFEKTNITAPKFYL